MKKLFKISIAAMLIVAVIVTGVWALKFYDISLGGRVIFNISPDIMVTINGDAKIGNTEVSNYEYIADADEAPGAWDIGDLEFTSINETITYTFKFTNKSNDPINVKITPPTLSTDFTLETTLVYASNPSVYHNNEHEAKNISKDDMVTFAYTLKINTAVFTGGSSLSAQVNYDIDVT